MNIICDLEQGAFRLDTPCSSYVMALADRKWLGHVYYGPRLTAEGLEWAQDYWGIDQRPYTPERFPREEATFFDRFPGEYPMSNTGDFQECCLSVGRGTGIGGCMPEFASCEILPGKPALEGLPATFGKAADCNTLKITLRDRPAGVAVELYYTAFTRLDVITRSARIVNEGGEALRLDRALSACLHLPGAAGSMLTLSGSWARECGVDVREIGPGIQGAASCRGISSHQSRPFIAAVSRDVNQERGEVYAMHFVYSGNFLAQIGQDQFGRRRMVMGIHPEYFSWTLEPGASFQTPEVVMTYSASVPTTSCGARRPSTPGALWPWPEPSAMSWM